MIDRQRMNGVATDATGTSSGAELLAAWREAVANEIAALEADNDATPLQPELEQAYKAARDHLVQVAAAAWAEPVRGAAGLRVRAEIAQHALWANYYGDGLRRFEAILAGEQPKEGGAASLGRFEERAIAELIRAVLWTAEPTRAAPTIPEAGDVADLVDRAKGGLMTLRTLWNTHATMPAPAPDAVFSFATSMKFTTDAIEGLLDDIAEAVAAASADRDAASEGTAEPSA
jgi:hypothetical protein